MEIKLGEVKQEAIAAAARQEESSRGDQSHAIVLHG